MKVVFLQDVPHVARAGQTREVADGYGRNYLLPRKLAAVATPAAVAAIEARLKTEARSRVLSEAEAADLAQQLDGAEISLKAKAGAKGRLYGSVTTADIASGISSAMGVVVDKRKIELAEAIRELGTYEVPVRLGRELVPKVKVTVTAMETD
ncbi:MAG: 50S ribosomal protein L9 [Chloroflexi bacterium]|nr:50S ribosomal protein L9 [Chloroflexota bacterium]